MDDDKPNQEVKPLLSVIVPSYKRRRYLAECLDKLQRQSHARVEVLVVLDPSNDGSERLLNVPPCRGVTREGLMFWNEHVSHPRAIVNKSRIGFAGSFTKGVQEAQGEYCWLLGDDDILLEGAVKTMVNALEIYQPGLMLMFDAAREWIDCPSGVFNSLGEWLAAAMQQRPRMVCEDTTLSARVFRRDLYSHATALQFMGTHYGHIYATSYGASQSKTSVYVLDRPCWKTLPREQRPLWSTFPESLDTCMRDYFAWLSNLTGVSCPVEAVLAEHHLEFNQERQHPVQFAWSRRKALFRLDAWRYLLSRFIAAQRETYE